MSKLRTYFELADGTTSDIEGQLAAREERLRARLASVRHTVAVLSGKGGVGKSLITANLAATLADGGRAVGVVDADLNGPSMARLLGVERGTLHVEGDRVEPAIGVAGVKLMSMDLLLAGDDSPVRWRGPSQDSFLWRGTLETNALREFLADADWGELDYLLLDTPPGPERITMVRDVLPELGGLVVVTIPSDLSHFIVSKSVALARELSVPIVGYVENMAGYVCPHCGELGRLFESGEGSLPGVARLGRVPFDPTLGGETDAGRPGVLGRPSSAAANALREVAESVRAFFEDGAR